RHRALNLPTEPASQSGPGKVRRPKPSLAGENCLACGAALGGYRPGPLCSACRDRSEREPQTIPGYRIIKELGRGSMGTVSLALRARDDLSVALTSVIPAAAGSRDTIDRFLRE